MLLTRAEKLEKFGEGPWLDESDRELWQSEGFDCLMVRGPVGAWCGYVGLKKGHPFFEKHYNDIDGIEVHGGLTYSEHSQGVVCHPSDDGDHTWWVGFDRSHYFDFAPRAHSNPTARMLNELCALADMFLAPKPKDVEEQVYRDLGYVKAEVESLARQLRRLA